MDAPQETFDFLLAAKSLRVVLDGAASNAAVAGPNHAHTQVLLAVPPQTKPGEYTAKLAATSATGEERVTTLAITVKPMVTVPSGSSRPPVVLLNGWETGFTGACTVSNSSSDTFGNLAQYLIADGVPVVYFFDNCVVDPNQTLEVLGNDLGALLNGIKYDTGGQVPQIDLVGFSMGGLIARSYLSGLQSTGIAVPPATTLVRKLILIATPNFGSFAAGNYLTSIPAGTQTAELIPGSSFLWNLATWNQRADDLRGVDALAVIGNAGTYVPSLSATTQLNNASDGLVTLTSASLGFALPDATPTQIVPYCHVDPSVFTNNTLGTFACNAAGIANVTSETQATGEIVRSFLKGTTDWQKIGGTPAADPWLSKDGGIFFAMQSESGAFVTDLTAVAFGSVALMAGGDTATVFYTDFVSGTGDYQASSSSLGATNCATLTEAPGYFSAARCKINTAIFSVGPLTSAPGRNVSAGAAITLTGIDFGTQCTSCQVLATPVNSSTQTALQVNSWTSTAISAMLPASMTGLLTITVKAVPGTDAITIMATTAAAGSPGLAATPSTLPYAYTASGAVPAAQNIQITNSGSGTLAWTATASQPWLTLSAASGTAPSTLSVSVSPAALSAGNYTGTVQITATGATNSPLTINVALTVAASGATLGATPAALNFDYAVGSGALAAQNVSIAIGGAGALSWTATSSVFWASVSPASGIGSGTLSVSVNPANLAAGSYSGNVTITSAGAAGSPASVSLTLVVQGTQPAGAITSVANAASFQPGFASATWIAIYGTNLSTSTQTWGSADIVNGVLPATLDGVSVTINGIAAYVEYISPAQINVLAPDDAATGAVQVQVTAAGQKSNSFTARKQPLAPAFFTIDNGKYAAALHNTGYTYVGASSLFAGATPAKPGEIILLYGTGFGPTDPASPTGQEPTATVPLPANSVRITIGGMAATIDFAGLIPGAAGLYQFDVVVPSLPSGDAAVVATIGGVPTQTGVSITIQQ